MNFIVNKWEAAESLIQNPNLRLQNLPTEFTELRDKPKKDTHYKANRHNLHTSTRPSSSTRVFKLTERERDTQCSRCAHNTDKLTDMYLITVIKLLKNYYIISPSTTK